MRLFIMRHGEAGFKAASDHERCLTEKGVQQVNSVADYLRKKVISLDKILVSPYIRTRQTADILVEQLSLPSSSLRPTNTLIPGASIEEALALLPYKGSWLFVSHMPFVERLTCYLVEGSIDGYYPFHTAQLIELKIYSPMAGGSSLIEMFTPV